MKFHQVILELSRKRKNPDRDPDGNPDGQPGNIMPPAPSVRRHKNLSGKAGDLGKLFHKIGELDLESLLLIHVRRRSSGAGMAPIQILFLVHILSRECSPSINVQVHIQIYSLASCSWQHLLFSDCKLAQDSACVVTMEGLKILWSQYWQTEEIWCKCAIGGSSSLPLRCHGCRFTRNHCACAPML